MDKPQLVTQLISPPPEETLRRTPSSSKRKRRVPASVPPRQEQTPNPKPRKQAKHFPASSESPTRSHLQVTDTNIIFEHPTTPQHVPTDPFLDHTTLDVKPTRTRRSITPIPHYDPPSVVFTPPREVMATPTISKSSKRKSCSKSHPKLKIVPVKKELPEIDLGVSMPPPSPTDDPILLSGPSGSFLSSPSRPSSRTSKSLVTSSTQTDLLPIPSSNDMLGSEEPAFYDWREYTRPVTASSPLNSSSLMDIHPSDVNVTPVDLPVFHLNDLPPSSDEWSDSDDYPLDPIYAAHHTIEEGEGEYTGRWRTLLVKTKQDPPSSATRARMKQWGRPISPFPEQVKSIQFIAGDEDAEGTQLDKAGQAHQDMLEEEEVLRISLEPDDAPVNPDDTQVDDQGEYLLGTPVAGSIPPSEPYSSLEVPTTATHTEDRLDIAYTKFNAADNAELTEGEHDESSGDEGDESFVTISSVDPLAAARAAAILKQYNYDCFTEISKSRRQSGLHRALRRATDVGEALARKCVTEGRIEKQRPKRRSSVGTGVIGSRVFVSGVPVTTLGSLLKEAEAEVSFSFSTPHLPPNETFDTHFSAHTTFNHSLMTAFTEQGSERHWTKDDWKLLDSCFTDERIAVGTEHELADVDSVELNNVVQRCIDLLGGEDITRLSGSDWDRESILQRVRALRRKQCSGNVAPPTTPLPSYTSDFDLLLTPDIDVPDFTPLRERQATKRAMRAHEALPTMHNTTQILQIERIENKMPLTSHSPSVDTTAVDDSSVIHAKHKSLQHSANVLPSSKGDLDIDDSSNAAPLTTPATLGGRVKGFLYSYLTSLTKLRSPHSRTKAAHPPPRYGLPLPPPDLLEKARGPVTTPARPQLPKAKPPKDLVQLHPAPLPVPKASKIPKLAIPQRLVKLNPVTPAEPMEVLSKFKPRSSSGSVKDLIESFEELGKTNGAETECLKSRPAWRP